MNAFAYKQDKAMSIFLAELPLASKQTDNSLDIVYIYVNDKKSYRTCLFVCYRWLIFFLECHCSQNCQSGKGVVQDLDQLVWIGSVKGLQGRHGVRDDDDAFQAFSAVFMARTSARKLEQSLLLVLILRCPRGLL